jgi:hypothetical protein
MLAGEPRGVKDIGTARIVKCNAIYWPSWSHPLVAVPVSWAATCSLARLVRQTQSPMLKPVDVPDFPVKANELAPRGIVW